MTGLLLKQTVENLFSVVRDRSSTFELYFICPEPGCGDESGNRSVNLKTGKTNCWRCNHGGDFVKWAKWLGFIVDDKAPQMAVPLDQLDLTAWVPQKHGLPPVVEIPLPQGFAYCSDYPNSVYTEFIEEMAQRKRLTLEDLVEAKVGFTNECPKWEPYAIFPVCEDDRSVYYQGRTYVDVPGESTKRFPNQKEAPHGAKYWIYNIDQVRQQKPSIVIVVESILNVLSLKRYFREHQVQDAVPVAVFKHYISKPQMMKLSRIRSIRELCLLYDHDATRSSWDKSPLLADRLRISIAEMPPGENNRRNDPNDDVVAAFDAFEKRQRFNPRTALVRLAEANSAIARQESGRLVDETPALPPSLNPLEAVLQSVNAGSRVLRADETDSEALWETYRTRIGRGSF